MKKLSFIFLMLFSTYATSETLWLGIDTQNLLLYGASGDLVLSDTVDTGRIDYDGTLNSGGADISSTSFYLHDVVLSENSNGSVNAVGYVDMYGTINNLFSGSWIFDYNYDDVSDVTIFGISSLDSDGDGILGVQLTAKRKSRVACPRAG